MLYDDNSQCVNVYFTRHDDEDDDDDDADDNEYVDGRSHPVIHHGLTVCRDSTTLLKRYKFVFA